MLILLLAVVTAVVLIVTAATAYNGRVRRDLVGSAPPGAHVGEDATVAEAKARIEVWRREQEAMRILDKLADLDDGVTTPFLSSSMRADIDALLARSRDAS